MEYAGSDDVSRFVPFLLLRGTTTLGLLLLLTTCYQGALVSMRDSMEGPLVVCTSRGKLNWGIVTMDLLKGESYLWIGFAVRKGVVGR